MAITTEARPDGILVITVGESFETTDVEALVGRLDGPPLGRYLWDLRELVEGPGSAEEVRRMAGTMKGSRDRWLGSRTAILVRRDVDFGIARMFQAFAPDMGVEFNVFREKEEALRWVLEDDTEGV